MIAPRSTFNVTFLMLSVSSRQIRTSHFPVGPFAHPAEIIVQWMSMRKSDNTNMYLTRSPNTSALCSALDSFNCFPFKISLPVRNMP